MGQVGQCTPYRYMPDQFLNISINMFISIFQPIFILWSSCLVSNVKFAGLERPSLGCVIPILGLSRLIKENFTAG